MKHPHIKSPRSGSALFPAASTWQWQDDSACRDSDLDLFFGTDPNSIAEAKRVCASCPLEIRKTCLDYAITTPERYGVWGGFSADERKKERLRRMRGYPARYDIPAIEYRQIEPVAPDESIRLLKQILATGMSIREAARTVGVEAKTLRRLASESPQAYITENTERQIAVAHASMFASGERAA